MDPRLQICLNVVALIGITGATAFFLRTNIASPSPITLGRTATTTEPTTASVPSTVPPAIHATTTPAQKKKAPVLRAVEKPTQEKMPSTTATATAAAPSASSTNDATGQATRIAEPYNFPPESTDKANTDTRAALVNILCRSRGSISPISASGVVIDARGVIMTNAHVAQYVLLSQNTTINLSCVVRTGSPAHDAWKARVLYMPPAWVAAHASELNTHNPMGTGEHDYALLLVTGSATTMPLPAQFPTLLYDTRERIGFAGDQVLVAGYPAEFVGGIQTQNNLFAATSVTTIAALLTFSQGSVDVLSLGGIIEAQGGSSGGAVVNPWGRLIGLITTTSEGATTADRDLHALSLSYIDRDLRAETSSGLAETLAGDLVAKQSDFDTRLLPDLMKQFMAQIKPAQ